MRSFTIAFVSDLAKKYLIVPHKIIVLAYVKTVYQAWITRVELYLILFILVQIRMQAYYRDMMLEF